MTPSPVSLSASFLGLGANHSCAGNSSKLSCWGANTQDQVYRSGPDQPLPKEVLSNARAVVGGVGHTCAVTTNQEMKCWGLNDKEQLGTSGSGHEESDPLSGVQAAAAGYKHTCALKNGAALCWGSNDRGQLGSDPASTATGSRPEALPVSGL
jgi:hypothetical protein